MTEKLLIVKKTFALKAAFRRWTRTRVLLHQNYPFGLSGLKTRASIQMLDDNFTKSPLLSTANVSINNQKNKEYS